MRVNHKAVVLLAAGFMFLCQSQAQGPASDRPDKQDGSFAGVSPHPDAISYRSRTPQLRKIDDPTGEYCRIVLPGHHYTSETGKPELPVYSRIVEVPQGMKVKVALSG
ncbi:MAG TPA: C25 family peptidase propeptide domain-containing protein, partial [Bacteroidales bacterium]|nr:C25 family peptidase propeptide domain-containing protein [Bacteroidales bacterium]